MSWIHNVRALPYIVITHTHTHTHTQMSDAMPLSLSRSLSLSLFSRSVSNWLINISHAREMSDVISFRQFLSDYAQKVPW